MKKYLCVILISTTFLSSAHAMRKANQDMGELSKTTIIKKSSSSDEKLDSSGSDSDEKSILQLHHTNLEAVVLQQQNIIEQFTTLQIQWAQFSKSTEVVRELKKKKLQERMTAKKRERIAHAGNEAVYHQKIKCKTEKINNYRLYKEKIDHEIRRATDEGQTRFLVDGVRQYEPVEICVEDQWLSIGDFRKKRNAIFDKKQKEKKDKLLESVRKKAEEEETRKVYKELLEEIDQL